MTAVQHIVALCERNGTLTDVERGALNVLLDRHANTKSTPQMDWFLYGKAGTGAAGASASTRIPLTCGFPARFKREHGRTTDRTTKDVEALLTLYRQEQRWVCPACGHRTAPDRKTCEGCKAPRGDTPLSADRRIELCLELRSLLTQRSQASCRIHKDGRIRTSVNCAATETFRHATYAMRLKAGDEYGYALHTTPKSMKHLLVAKPGHWLGSVDLAGADSWTVACEMAQYGDDSMLRDLRDGVKPAQAVALLYLHGAQVNQWTPAQIREALSSIDTVKWLYAASKAAIHLTSYGGGSLQVQVKIIKESFKRTGKPLFVGVPKCELLQNLTHLRYRGIRWRMEGIRTQLRTRGYIETPAGCRRKFFGAPGDGGTEREAFAFVPQVLTTYCTELAWSRCWHDAENWPSGTVGEGAPVVSPLLLVHDSLVSMWPQERTDWARAKWAQWLDNPVTIAGTTVTIPWSGSYGVSWGDKGEAL